MENTRNKKSEKVSDALIIKQNLAYSLKGISSTQVGRCEYKKYNSFSSIQMTEIPVGNGMSLKKLRELSHHPSNFQQFIKLKCMKPFPWNLKHVRINWCFP